MLRFDRVHHESDAQSMRYPRWAAPQSGITFLPAPSEYLQGLARDRTFLHAEPLVTALRDRGSLYGHSDAMATLDGHAPKRLKTSDLPLSQAKRSAIDGLVHQFKKKGDFDNLRKKAYAQFNQDV